MNQKLKLDDSISSPQDLQALIVEIRDYARWSSHNAIKKQVHATKHTAAPPAVSPAALATIKAFSGGKSMNRESFDRLIATLEDYAKKAPTLTVTLAAPVTAGFKKTLVAWCRDNISPTVLVTFQFNSGLLGGMVVRFGSRVYDWSFRRAILANANKFPEVLRSQDSPATKELNNV